ncbi:MAG TPA: aldolase/citrate lyase family protein, partial [Ktedonobacteraceae bacterium]|nr:aldolase/citrate lyase family protein [Ktedonobacteraceae bacterium]
MRVNQVKAKLKRGEPALGAWLSLPSVPSARLMARLGFDWLVVDMEHTAQNPTLMADMVATIADAGTSAPFVRLPGHNVEWFKWALDAGAWGVIVPMVNTRAEAEAVVRACRYYPLGNRSNAGVRGEWGEFKNYRDYMDAVNNELVILPMIETNQALENLDAIASVPGVDVLLIGP